jgi:hypothetical protein
MFDSIDYSRSLPFTPNWNELIDAVTKTTDLIGLNETTAEAGMIRINNDISSLLK